MAQESHRMVTYYTGTNMGKTIAQLLSLERILFLSACCVCLSFPYPALAMDSDSEQVRAKLHVEVHVKREPGVGDCGSPPWGVDHIDGGDFRCHPPKYWYGYSLVANMTRNDLRITPGKDGEWTLSGAESAVHGTGHYHKLSHWSDGQRICSPASIRPLSEFFAFEAEGTVNNGEITLQVSTIPEEISSWKCRNGHSYERKTSLLLLNWATAMASSPGRNLQIHLSPKERTAPGAYQLQFAKSMNPSPQDRDFTTVDIQLKCFSPQQNSTSTPWQDDTVPCPWES